MRRKFSGECFAFLIVVLLLVLFSFNICSTHSLRDETVQREYRVTQSTVSGNALDVIVWVFLAERYEFFDIDIRDEVVVDITTRLSDPLTTPYVISVSTLFSLAEVTDLPQGANYTYGFRGYPQSVGVLSIYLPANMSYSSIKLRGHMSGSSVFWKNTAEIFFLDVKSGSVAYAPSYTLIVVPPSASKVLKVYSRFYPNIRYQEANVGEQKCIIVSESHPRSPIVVLYQHENWETYVLILMTVMIFMVYAIPHAFKSKKNSAVPIKLIVTLRKSFPIKLRILRRLYNGISKVDSSKLLTAYILCAILMVSLSFTVGPDPRLKVYVLASTPETAKTISEFVHREAGAVAITIYDVMGAFGTLTDFGVFSAAIIGDFFPGGVYLERYIYPGLDSVPQIVILKDYVSHAFLLEIQERYPDKTIVVKDLAALGPALYRMPRRTNTLGLNVSPLMYIGVVTFVGLCSFILVFFGLAFLAGKLIEVGKKPGVSGFPEAIAYSVFVFIFSQIVYIASSVLLAMPLGLHAGGSEVTAVGFLGFGGGSKPRLTAGLAGFLFGSFVSLKGGLKLDKAGFISFLAMSFFIILDPLTGGTIFYEFVLLFTVGPGMEHAYMAWSYVRSFLGTIAEAFGAGISPTYAISSGIILYYTGAVPFCLFAKLKKSTATVLFLFCAFCVSDGYIRVADMSPWKAFASVIPGVMSGLVVVAIFGLLSLIEVIMREKIGASAKFV